MKNKNLHIAIFSTLFAVALWLSITMGYEYQTVVSVPLILENIKPNRSLAKPVPPSVNIKVYASGWQLVGFPGPRMSNYDDLTKHFGEAFRPKPISLEQAIGRKVRTSEDEDRKS